jgi:hypothetical protein
MDELTRLELNRRLAPLKNSELLAVIEVKKHVRGITLGDLQRVKSLDEEIEFARSLYAMRMGLS